MDKRAAAFSPPGEKTAAFSIPGMGRSADFIALGRKS